MDGEELRVEGAPELFSLSTKGLQEGSERVDVVPLLVMMAGMLVVKLLERREALLAKCACTSSLSAVSPSQFRRKFIAITGEPPASYILNLRLSNAQRLIDSHGEWSFSEVAYRCGFSDSAHFANAFKRAFGMPPRSMPTARNSCCFKELFCKSITPCGDKCLKIC